MAKYTLDKQGAFVIEDYNRSKSFASFLPAIAGTFGIPLWCFYVNRGQAIASFGIRDKNHSILEFLPANKSYGAVFEKGFRTFLKADGRLYEPFALNNDTSVKQTMRLTSASFELEEENKKLGLRVRVRYFTLPSQAFPALLRRVEIENTLNKSRTFEIVDGLSYIVPYGARDLFLKDLSRTLEAWMDSSVKANIAFYRLRVAPQDVAHTEYIKGANFYFSCSFSGGKANFLRPIADPSCVFGDDVGLSFPHAFARPAFVYPRRQIFSGKTPCALGHTKKRLSPRGVFSFHTFVGSSEDEGAILTFARDLSAKRIEDKFQENRDIVERVKNRAFVRSASSKLDLYIGQSYLDNVLRGGFPEDFPDGDSSSVQYIYSRKHGDLERDYNKFKLANSFLSAGEGNFRDMNQNRRCDVFFNPRLGRKNIQLFFNLQRPDAYNPLVVKPCNLVFEDKDEFRRRFKDIFPGKLFDPAWEVFSREFTLADLFAFLKEHKVPFSLWEKTAGRMLNYAGKVECADFGEGFWTDHWTYNLDLIESYLALFPDREEELFFEREYFFYDDFCRVNRRLERFALKDGKVTQHNFLHFDPDKAHEINSRRRFRHRVRIKNTDEVYYTNLLVKLLVIVLNKVATLDPFGLGIEMEAGKPGWCDALNGLPALLGSSLPETFELKRLCLFVRRKLSSRQDKKIRLSQEIATFFSRMRELLSDAKAASDSFSFWDRASRLKEEYRQDVFSGFSEPSVEISLSDFDRLLAGCIAKIDAGLNALEKKQALPTYFINEVIEHSVDEEGRLRPLTFKNRPLPPFLEGFVRAYKTWPKKKIKAAHALVKKGPLYDKKLKMYKINASLAKEPLEIGRMRVFKPGWLENESIWLHMEYKYLLELLKAGLFDQFYEEFHNCAVCFQDPASYGRSISENSSFIVSSAYLDEKLWRRGFVARLSGSTAEMANIILLMAAGKDPFFVEKGELFLEFKPALAGRLFTKQSSQAAVFINGRQKKVTVAKDAFCFKFLADTLVTYHNPKRLDTYSHKALIRSIKITYRDAKVVEIPSPKIPEPHSLRVRNTEAERIEVFY
ncbi:cellobiose phosphorylase [Candidatus Omnitrophota bacterium]